jgi:hypothetical protein
MAYGNTTAGEYDVAAATVDDWMNEGNNALDLFSSHNPVLAILMDQSEQPGGEYQFKQSAGAKGMQFKTTVFAKANTTVDGVTRANQVNAIAASVGGTTALTNPKWNWAHYQGLAQDNYIDRVRNSGDALRVDVGQFLVDQVIASFYDVVGTDLLDAAADAEDKILSFNSCLLNSGTVGGIDQSDATNNAWWQAIQDTTAEVINTQTIDKLVMDATYDCGKKTGIMRMDPDIMIMPSDLCSKIQQDLKQSQRVEVSTMIRGGARYVDYNGMRIFWTGRTVTGTVLGLNSTTWTFRYDTKAPDPVTPGWVPMDRTPAMFSRGYNWVIGLGNHSCKHQFYMSNKRAS